MDEVTRDHLVVMLKTTPWEGDTMKKLPKIGDRVLVPIGREMVEGTVLDARNFLGGLVMVETPLWSWDPQAPTTTSTYELDRVQPVADVSSGRVKVA
jgi:hypothetical protein